MSQNNVINVLYVDDEPNNLISFTSTFRREFNVHTALSAKEAESILDNENEIHVLITDQRMHPTLGTELLIDMVKKYPKQTRIILTAYPEDKEVQEAQNMQLIYRAIGKPWDADELKELIIEGHDIFCSKINQKIRLYKHSQISKELNKRLNKKGKPKK